MGTSGKHRARGDESACIASPKKKKKGSFHKRKVEVPAFLTHGECVTIYTQKHTITATGRKHRGLQEQFVHRFLILILGSG